MTQYKNENITILEITKNTYRHVKYINTILSKTKTKINLNTPKHPRINNECLQNLHKVS